MTFATMQTRVQKKLRSFGDITWDATEIKQAINDGYWEFCRITHILQKRDYVTITHNTATFSLPETPTSGTDTVSSIIKVWNASWRLVDSPYTETPLTVMSTRKMDRIVGDWRSATGENVQYVLTDAADISKITIYPMIDTAAHAAERKLYVNYSYLPVEMSATSDTPGFAEAYHMACVEYAVSTLKEDDVQSKQDPFMGDRAMIRFYRLAAAAKAQVNAGMFGDPDNSVILRAV